MRCLVLNDGLTHNHDAGLTYSREDEIMLNKVISVVTKLDAAISPVLYGLIAGCILMHLYLLIR